MNINHNSTYDIPEALRNTQLAKIIDNEIEYKKLILNEIKEITNNFSSNNIKSHLKIRFIAKFLAKIFKVYHLDKNLTSDIVNGIDSVLLSREHIGTDNSFNLLFASYLYTNVELTTNKEQAGEIVIKLLNNIKSPFRRYIVHNKLDKVVGNEKVFKFKKIVIIHSKGKFNLMFNYMPLNYTSSIYEFIKSLIPVGRVVRIKDRDNQVIMSNSAQETQEKQFLHKLKEQMKQPASYSHTDELEDTSTDIILTCR
ncbi:hypothetical protein DB313_05610 (plasmid) [Borrelia turcica IST7]|uniref:Uncharacterized protein n=1 Tax=Borrelia turcica IST7 TaxID=1104446 RepID=A0A386PPR1_9SPIR|nr:DUF735 family protein [Borrelia turcica]AYE36975.1 hypothetical protein DB313_05610 [Borrelia turcica IST7]